jgi:hypothetical protein
MVQVVVEVEVEVMQVLLTKLLIWELLEVQVEQVEQVDLAVQAP